jgi:Fe2+ or Zn2+ uptake regulation protein
MATVVVLLRVEVLLGAQAKDARVGITTVYRTIKTLAYEECLVRVVVARAAPRYEVRGQAHHHHLQRRSSCQATALKK